MLDLATEVGALLIVSEDADLTSMSPWRGVPILRAAEFVVASMPCAGNGAARAEVDGPAGTRLDRPGRACHNPNDR